MIAEPVSLLPSEMRACGMSFRKPKTQYNRLFGPECRFLPEHLRVKHKIWNHGRMAVLGRFMVAGFPDKRIANITGSCARTINSLRQILEHIVGEPFRCGCGRAASHEGRCLWRINGYPRRRSPVNDISLERVLERLEKLKRQSTYSQSGITGETGI